MNSTSRPEQRPSLGQSLAGARLRKHADYQRAYAAARKRQSASMSWFMAPQFPARPAADTFAISGAAVSSPAHLGPRVGLTVGKVIGKAHERNRIKRRMKEALRRHVGLLPEGFDLIFHPRRTVLTMDFVQLEAEVVRILEQAREQVREQVSIEAARAAKLPGTASVSRAAPAS